MSTEPRTHSTTPQTADGILIRPLFATEAEAVAALVNGYRFRPGGTGALLPVSPERVLEIIEDPSKGSFFAAIGPRGDLAGCVSVVIYGRPSQTVPADLSEHIVELRSLVVSPDYRNSGLGARLIHTATDEAARLGFAKLYAFVNARVLPLFERSTFTRAMKPPQKLLAECNSCPIQMECAEISVVADIA